MSVNSARWDFDPASSRGSEKPRQRKSGSGRRCDFGIAVLVSGSYEWATKKAGEYSALNGANRASGVKSAVAYTYVVYAVGSSPFDYRFSRCASASAEIPYSIRIIGVWREGVCVQDYSRDSDRNRLPSPLKHVEVPWPRDASAADVKRFFRRWALLAHPDKGGDPEVFIGVHAEYERFMRISEWIAADASGSVSSGVS